MTSGSEADLGVIEEKSRIQRCYNYKYVPMSFYLITLQVRRNSPILSAKKWYTAATLVVVPLAPAGKRFQLTAGHMPARMGATRFVNISARMA